MNVRWLFGNFTDPQYKLSLRDQFRLSNLAHEKYLPRKILWERTAVISIPVIIYVFSMQHVLDALGLAGRNLPFIIAIGVLVAWCWPFSAWMYRSIYIKPIRRAMRDAGYILCIECGYDLRGHDETMTRCPECGEEREIRRPPNDAAAERGQDGVNDNGQADAG